MKGPAAEKLEGQRFGNLIVLKFYGYGRSKTNKRDRFWLCKCDCGKEKAIRSQSLKQSLTKTCGITGCPYRNKYKVSGGKTERQRACTYAIVYNLYPDEYSKILEYQGGICPISQKPPSENIRLNIDHDHKTGLIRGVLNWKINKALGLFNDDPEMLRRAADYLDNPPAVKALGEPVYGMMGRAMKSKKKRKYGPNGTKERHPRLREGKA